MAGGKGEKIREGKPRMKGWTEIIREGCGKSVFPRKREALNSRIYRPSLIWSSARNCHQTVLHMAFDEPISPPPTRGDVWLSIFWLYSAIGLKKHFRLSVLADQVFGREQLAKQFSWTQSTLGIQHCWAGSGRFHRTAISTTKAIIFICTSWNCLHLA